MSFTEIVRALKNMYQPTLILKVWEELVRRLERRLEKVAEEGIPVTSLKSGLE